MNCCGNFGRFVSAFVVFAASNFGLTLFACLITAFIAPEAAGSGIPEVKAYLNGVDAPAIFSLKTLLVKVTRRVEASVFFVFVMFVQGLYFQFMEMLK